MGSTVRTRCLLANTRRPDLLPFVPLAIAHRMLLTASLRLPLTCPHQPLITSSPHLPLTFSYRLPVTSPAALGAFSGGLLPRLTLEDLGLEDDTPIPLPNVTGTILDKVSVRTPAPFCLFPLLPFCTPVSSTFVDIIVY